MVMQLSLAAMLIVPLRPYYVPIPSETDHIVKTLAIQGDRIRVELTEFEMMALAALVERGQAGIDLQDEDHASIRTAIHTVAEEFRSLLGHFELAA